MSSITREQIDAAIANQEGSIALAGLKQLFRETPSLATAQFVLSRTPKLETSVSRVTGRVFFLRSFTIEPVVPLLQAAASLYGIDLQTQIGDFNAYPQEILAPDSPLYRFEPQIVVLAVQTRDLLPDLWNRYAEMSPAEVAQSLEQTLANLRNWIGIFRSRSQASLLLPTLEIPTLPVTGVLDWQGEQGQTEAIQSFNRELRKLVREFSGVYLLDYDGLVARFGRERWHDERKWLTMRMPIAADCLISLASEYLRFVVPLMGKGCKAIVVDLDNTLWGGVIGEDGMTGIRLGAEYPGAGHLALQRALLDCYQRGILLAVCSKNNPADALEALEQHPEMLLRPHHFAALRINWNDKAQNLREIAAELNIGIDSLAFVDDNPAERERVRRELPEVTVLELPTDPIHYAHTLRDCPAFERLTLSAEDRERGRYYAEQRQRTEMEQSAGSLEDFYRSLKMEAEMAPVTAATLARTAQLTQKTNQFNLTTRRYTEPQIEEMQASSEWRVYSLRVKDCFGDNGLVGVAILHSQDKIAEIDTFLLSCRVIGRTVETAFLAFLVAQAKHAGAERLQGWFLPTKKNAPAQEFYASHQFTQVREEEGNLLWEVDLNSTSIACPEWIVCHTGGAS